MRITKCSVVLLLAVCLSYPALAAKDKKASNTYQANCIVTMDVNPDVYPVRGSAFETLIFSSGVAKKAYRHVFKSECNDIYEVLQVELLGMSIREKEEEALRKARESYRSGRSPEVSEVGGYGGGRSRSSTSRRPAPRPSSVQNISLGTTRMFMLEVELPKDDPEIKPLAEEFLAEVIENMEDNLLKIYRNQRQSIEERINIARSEFNHVNAKIEELTSFPTAGSQAIKEQLSSMVDLSELKVDMPVAKAFEVLSKSTRRHMPIVVMWKDLSENAFIEKEEEIGIDGGNMSAIAFGTALDLVLKSVASGNSAKVGYAIEGGVLIIATKEQLPASVPVEQSGNLLIMRSKLAHGKAQAELKIAEQEAYQLAITKQIAKVSDDMERKLAMDDISEKLNDITKLCVNRLKSVELLMNVGKATEVDVIKAEEALARARIEYVKRRQEVSKEAGGSKIRKLNDKLGDIAVDVSVKKSMYEVIKKQLNEVDAKLEVALKYEPKRSAIKAAKKALDVAEHNVQELKKQEANLKQPIVTVIGAN